MEKWQQEQRSYKAEDQVKKKDAANYLHGYREKNIGKTTASRDPSAVQQISTAATAGSSSQAHASAYTKTAASTGCQASATPNTNPERPGRKTVNVSNVILGGLIFLNK